MMQVDKPCYKQTELGWIPEEWELKELGEVLDKIDGGGTPSKKNKSYWNGPFPWASVKDLSNFEPNKTQDYITEEGLKNSSSKLIKAGTIIMATRMAVGKAVRFRVDVAINQDLKALVPNAVVENDYLALFIAYNESNLSDLGSGSTVNGLRLEQLCSFPIPLPPLPEQRKIAAILSTWDKAIKREAALIVALQTRHRALMQRLLTGKVRLKGFEGDWKEVRLEEIFNRVTRRNTEGNKTVVTISAQRGFVLQNDFFNKVVASDITDNYFLVKQGEFCYNKSYSNGYPWGATKRLTQFDKAVVTTLYICFGLKKASEQSADFFEHFFEANALDKGLMKIAHEGGRAHGLLNVTPTDFFNLKISIPSLPEQTAIARILTTSQNEITRHRSHLALLQEQKKGLMQQLLTGKKRITL